MAILPEEESRFLNGYAIRGKYFNFSTVGQWMWDEIKVSIPPGAGIPPSYQGDLRSDGEGNGKAECENGGKRKWKRGDARKKDRHSLAPCRRSILGRQGLVCRHRDSLYHSCRSGELKPGIICLLQWIVDLMQSGCSKEDKKSCPNSPQGRSEKTDDRVSTTSRTWPISRPGGQVRKRKEVRLLG